jgi:hypothetical protein
MAIDYNKVTIKTIRDSGAKNLTEYKEMTSGSSSSSSNNSSSSSSSKSSTPPLGKDSTGLSNPYVKGSENYLEQERANFNSLPGTSTSLLDEGTDTLTIINKDTGQIVRQGTRTFNSGLPSLSGGAKTQEEFETGLREFIQKQPDVLPKTLTPAQELVLKSLLNQPIQTMYIRDFQPLPIPQSSVNVDEVKKALDTPSYFRTIQDKKVIEEAYVKSQAEKVFLEQQRIKEAQNKLMRDATFGSQKVLSTEREDIILPGEKGYYELGVKNLPVKEPERQPSNIRVLGLPKDVKDITKEQYLQGVGEVKKNSPSIVEIIEDRLVKRSESLLNFYGEEFKDTEVKVGSKNFGVFKTKFLTGLDLASPSELKESSNKMFFGTPLLRTIGDSYDTITDVASIFIAGGTKSFLTGGMLIGKNELMKYEAEGILNPRQASLEDLKRKQEQLKEERLNDFFLSKQIVESGSIVIGGTPALVSYVGQGSRAESVEEIALPLALGVVGRVAAKPIGSVLEKLVGKTNKGLSYLETKIIPKTPLPLNVVQPNVLPRLNPSQASKAIILGGAGLEVAGIGFVPVEMKQDYIKTVGLFNVYTPLAYRVTDVGLMLGKTAAISGISLATSTASKITKKDLSLFDTYRYADIGGDDVASTPRFVGSEREMLLATQDISRPGAAQIMHKRFGIVPSEKGVGYGLRSVSGNLPDVIEPSLTYYEGTKIRFFGAGANPIAMRGSGLKAKLFGKVPGLYDDYSLVPTKPSYELGEFKRGVAISLKDGASLTPKSYKEFKEIYGWKGLDISFTKDVQLDGFTIPKGMTYGEADYLKLAKGRPIKSRGLIGITNEETFESLFIDMSKSKVIDIDGGFSTPSRAFGRTVEEEFATAVGGKRVDPFTFTRKIARKLGFADAYVSYDFEMIPLNYEKVGKSFDNGLVPFYNKVNFGDRKFLGTEQKLIGENNLLEAKQKNLLLSGSGSFVDVKKYFVGVGASPKVVDVSGMGDYSKELSETFGKRSLFSRSLFKPMIVSEPVSTSYKRSYNVLSVGLVSNSELKSYDKAYDQVYGSVYPVKYSDDYSPVYVDDYSPKYTTTYVPKRGSSYETAYTPSYTPDYTPPYNPPYVPPRTPPYKPPYKPPYVPPYTPPYNPPYVPPRTPPYKPPYKPPYVPPRTPPYKPKMNYYNLPQYGSSSKQKGYFSLVKKKGKWKKIDKTPRTFNAAWNKAATNADKTLSQSIKIIEANTPAVGREETLRLGKFKPSKRTLGVLVEKKKYALERDEIVEIKSAKKQKQGIGRFKLSL